MEFAKPLQWLVCQLHADELPLRHLLEHLDGVTAGPRASTPSKANLEELHR